MTHAPSKAGRAGRAKPGPGLTGQEQDPKRRIGQFTDAGEPALIKK